MLGTSQRGGPPVFEGFSYSLSIRVGQQWQEEHEFLLAAQSLIVSYNAWVGGQRMSRRDFFALGGAGAAVAGLSLTEAMSGRRDEPNLLVIMTDDQPYYTVSHTKAVASLLRDRGTTFSPYAYVSTPICGPARASLLTGKWSHNTGLTATTHPYAYHQLHTSGYESDTIATRLKKAGYVTFFGGKYQNGYDGKAKPPGWDAWFAMVEPVNKKDYFRYRTGTQIKR